MKRLLVIETVLLAAALLASLLAPQAGQAPARSVGAPQAASYNACNPPAEAGPRPAGKVSQGVDREWCLGLDLSPTQEVRLRFELRLGLAAKKH